MSTPQGRLKKIILYIFILLLPIAAAVVIFDPFFQYHPPLPGLKAVLTDRENQCLGSLRTLNYDAVLLGSSVLENFNNRWFDSAFSVRTIKAIRGSGSTTDLLYMLNVALKKQDLKYVFYGLDTSALIADTRLTLYDEGMPVHLYTGHPFDDLPYLFNKEVLLEKIPYMIFLSLSSDFDEGESYNWMKGKNFGAEFAIRHYHRLPEIKPMYDADYFNENWLVNIQAIKDVVATNPDTEFIFFFPPYSLFWWDNAYRFGMMEVYLNVAEQSVSALLEFDNVKIFYFQNDRDIILDADNYMDVVHYSDRINYMMFEAMVSGDSLLTRENYVDILLDMRNLAWDIAEKYIYVYF